MAVEERLREHDEVVLRPDLAAVVVAREHQPGAEAARARPLGRLVRQQHRLGRVADAAERRVDVGPKAGPRAAARAPVVDASKPKERIFICCEESKA